MTKKILLLTISMLLMIQTLSLAERITDPPPPGIPNGYYWISSIWLNDVDGDTLRQKYYQVIIVNGEPDPVNPRGVLVNDRLDSASVTIYNSEKIQQTYNSMLPGMVDIQFTTRAGDPVPDDLYVQYGENVLIRVFNADAVELATHYCETAPWECVPGLHKWYIEDDLFGDWIPIEK